LGKYLVEHASTLQVLPAGTRPEEGEVVTAAHVHAALGAMKRQFATTVVDCGSSFDEPTIAALELADKVILLCAPDLNSLRDVRECQRVFGEIIHLEPGKLCFVLNHPQPFSALTREQFETALEQPMLVELPHAGETAHKVAAKGEPLVASAPGSAFTRSIEKLSASVAPIEGKPARGRGFGLGRTTPVAPVAVSRPAPAPARARRPGLLGLFGRK
jgi:Flp pilus assembly CpaE family ATPase